MKLLFSEHKPDYSHYLYPYAIWAVPEPGETPADLFAAGFLPSSRKLDRFYLCRQVRVDLARFKLSSENRRILRKGAGLEATLVPRRDFDYNAERRQFYKSYADIRFGKDVMSFERLDSLFASPVISHLLVFTDTATGARPSPGAPTNRSRGAFDSPDAVEQPELAAPGDGRPPSQPVPIAPVTKCAREVGAATLYLEDTKLAYYYYGFYDLNYFAHSLGMFMMTSAVASFAERGFNYIYLGTCYSQNALYKTQFAGAQFFNGFRWSDDLDELKFLVLRQQRELHQHVLEDDEYRQQFYPGGLDQIAAASRLQVRLK